MKIYEQLRKVQEELKAPKGQYNDFGRYNYRSAEDILEAVKPILIKHGLTQVISDEIVSVNERYYISATVTIYNSDGESLSTTAYAREAENKKGMDESQITGSASSYARKYALNGMYAIDDTKDADHDSYPRYEEKKETKQPTRPKKAPPVENKANLFEELEALGNAMKMAKVSKEDMKQETIARYGKEKSTDLNNQEIAEMIDWLTEKIMKGGK